MYNVETHEVNAVCVRILRNKLIDRPVLHPVRNHRTSHRTDRNTNQWKDTRMSEMPPNHRFFAKSLGEGQENGKELNLTEGLTLRVNSWLIAYSCMTFTATGRF